MQEPGRGLVFDWQALLSRAFSMGIMPREFWRMSFYEFRACLSGHDQRLETQQAMDAWCCANLMNCWTQDTVSPAMLLGKEAPARETTDPEEFRARMLARQARARMEDV